MELDRAKKTIFSVMFVLALAAVITVAAYFVLKEGKADKPSSSDDGPIAIISNTNRSSSSGGSVYIGGILPSSPEVHVLEVIGPAYDFSTFGFASSLTEYLEKCNGNTDADGWNITGYKPSLEELKTMKCSDPIDDGTSGYISLFALMYSTLKDTNSVRHKIFFDTTGYDGIPAPIGFASVAKFFESLRDKLSRYEHASDYIKYNHHNVVLALRYIMIKHIWDVEEAIEGIVNISFPFLQNDFESKSKDCTNTERERLFKEVYMPIALKDIHNRAFWLTDEELKLFSCIFRLEIWVSTFETSIRMTGTPPRNEIVYKFLFSETGLIDIDAYKKTNLWTKNPQILNVNDMEIHLVCIDEHHYIPAFK